jgi:choice-of-anchor A domain-containing protein
VGAAAVLPLLAGLFSQARAATFVISGDPTNFAALYEGGGGKQLQTNNSNIAGNIGIGGTGAFAPAGGCSGPCIINGTVEFSASNTGQYGTNAGTTVTGGATFNNANVSADLTNLNTLSATLGGLSGTSLAINTGGAGGSQTINASSGTLSGGNRVFSVTSLHFNNATTLFINGDAAGDSVVFNIDLNAQFGGRIVLSGLSPDQVLFNIFGTNDTLQLSTNGSTLVGDFLDPLGAISANHSVLDGRLFGGDSSNMSIVSGVTIDAPVVTPIPAVGLPSIAVALVGLLFWTLRRSHKDA